MIVVKMNCHNELCVLEIHSMMFLVVQLYITYNLLHDDFVLIQNKYKLDLVLQILPAQ